MKRNLLADIKKYGKIVLTFITFGFDTMDNANMKKPTCENFQGMAPYDLYINISHLDNNTHNQ